MWESCRTMRSASVQAAVLLFSTLLLPSFATDCAAGKFSLNGKSPCKECPWGEFQARTGQTSCTRCVPGRFNDQETVPRIKCEQCPTGKTSGLNGIPLYRCDPVLTSSPTPQSAITSSPPTPSPTVSTCPAGRYLVVAAFDSSEHCLVCPAGKFSSPIHTIGCEQCSVGRVAGAPGLHDCIPCGKGRFSDSHRMQCVRSCPPGDMKTNANGCTTCPAGKISQRSASNACTRCPAGQYSNAGDLTARTRSRCVASCAPGEFATADSACELCPVGKFTADSGSTKCVLCPVGQVTYARGEDTCSMPCPIGRYRHAPAFAKHMKLRPVGHPGSCTGCPPGKYQSLAVSTSCKLCEAGRYQSRPGQATCNDCASGKISAPGSDTRDSCMAPCPMGRFHLRRMIGCLDCLPGYYQDVEGRDSCKRCNRGHFSARPGAKRCNRCPGAQLSVFTRRACVASCPAGSLRTLSTLSTGADGCERCPAGKYSHARNVACTQCPHGQLSNPARSACIAQASCRAGMYSDTFGCNHCSRGRYNPNIPPTTHATNGLSVDCVPCSRGYYQAREGAVRCDKCPRGKHSPDGSPGCVPCSMGHFAPANSVGVCEMCPLGKFRADESTNSALSCSVCPNGQVSLASRVGCTTIFTCEAGTFKKVANQGCTYCAAGRFQPSSLGNTQIMPQCNACGVGHFSSRGAAECTECVEGYEVNADRTMCRAPTPPPTPAPPTPNPLPAGGAESGSSGAAGGSGESGGTSGARAPSHFFIYGSFALRRETNIGWDGGESHKRKQIELAIHFAVREPAVEARVTRVVAGHFSRGVYVAFTLNCKAKGIRDLVNERMDGVPFLHSLAGQLRAAGFNVQAGELHFSHSVWNPTTGSSGPSTSPDGQGANQQATRAAGASPVKPWHKTTVFAVAMLAGALAIVGGCVWYLHWDKSSRRSRVNNYAQFNALPDSHHQVKPFFEKVEENIISGSDEDDEDGTLGGLLGSRSHRRDNEISDSDGEDDVDWAGNGARVDKRQLKGLDAFKSSAATSKSKRTRQPHTNNSGEAQKQEFGGYQQQANDDYDENTNEI